MIRIIFADDHSIVRRGLKQILELSSDMQVVGEAENGHELLTLIEKISCDLVMMDMTMPGINGIDLIKRVKSSGKVPAILVMSMHNEIQLVSRALKIGAAGYITKDSDPETLVAAIRKIAKGGKYIDPSLVDQIVFDLGTGEGLPHERLSNREFQIFELLISGKTVTGIAAQLSLSPKTISTHKLRLMEKMHIDSIANLTRYAMDLKLFKNA